MSKGFILLRDALAILACRDNDGNYIPASITWITADEGKQTGGRRLSADGVTLAGPAFGKKHSEKDPRHYMNGTRNIMVPGRPRPITIHNILLTKINGERVVPA